MNKPTLKSLFDSHKVSLIEKLKGYSLPNDSERIEQEVTLFLGKLFDSDGEYRLGLTQSEDYIMQAAISLLEAQRSMASTILSSTKFQSQSEPQKAIKPEPTNVGLRKELFPHAIGASALGGTVGGLVLGTWGAVFGSIAGTALILYYASQEKEKPKQVATTPKQVEYKQIPFDAEKYVTIVGNVCDCVDSLINTFRTQISRVIDKYENQPKPTIEKNYATLLEGIQSLIGYKRTHSPEEEKYATKIQQRIEDLAELLDNYNLEVVDYTEEHVDWFESVKSSTVSAPKMVYPAIVKNGEVVLKGKVFIQK